jgi:hypothetical protein
MEIRLTLTTRLILFQQAIEQIECIGDLSFQKERKKCLTVLSSMVDIYEESV